MRCENCECYEWCVMPHEQGSWCGHMRKLEPVEPPWWIELAQRAKRAIRKLAERLEEPCR